MSRSALKSLVDNPLSFCAVVVSWMVVLLCSCVTWYLVRKKYKLPVLKFESPEVGSSVTKFTYLIRIRTGNCTVNFDHRTAKIMMRFMDNERKPLASASLPANWISLPGQPDPASDIPEMRIVTFYWGSPTLLPTFPSLQVYHSCRVPNSTITIYDVDIRERQSSCLIKAMIAANIESLTDDNVKDQVFSVKPIGNPLEDDVESPAADYKMVHYLMLAFVYTSLSLCFTLIVPNSPKNLIDSTQSMINGAAAAPIAALMKGFWTLTWGVYGLTTGIIAGLYGANLDSTHTSDWTLGVLISIFIFLGPFTSFYFIYTLLCKRTPSKKHNDSKIFGNITKPQATAVQEALALPKTPSGISIQSTGSSYFQQLIKEQNIARVKSISQYGVLLVQQEAHPT